MNKKILLLLLFILAVNCSWAIDDTDRTGDWTQHVIEKGDKGRLGLQRLFEPVDCAARPIKSFSSEQPREIFSQGVVFSETFEGAAAVSPYPLPDGWTRQTASDTDAYWYASYMSYKGEPIYGHSGEKMAWILSNEDGSPHNSWAFSRPLNLKSGVTYKLSFFVMLYGHGNVQEHVRMCLGANANITSMTQELASIQGEYHNWHEVSATFTVLRSGTYYLGMQDCTEGGGDMTMVDDISIVEFDSGALIDGNESIDFGLVYTQEETVRQTYTIKNLGSEPLDVSLLSASGELSFQGLPATVPAESSADIDVILTIPGDGAYQGTFTLSTSDGYAPEVTISTTAEVTTLRETDFWYEDFETPGLPGWTIGFGGANVTSYGVDESRSYLGSTYHGNQYIMTHVVDMGDTPELSFDYRFDNFRMFETDPVTPAKMEYVRMTILASADFGRSWETVYQAGSETEIEIPPTLDYERFSLALPEYAGKRVIFMLYFDRTGGDVFTEAFDVNIDNIAIGTRPEQYIYLSNLMGETGYDLNSDVTNTVQVDNLGSETTVPYIIQLTDRSGKILATAEGPSLEAGGREKVTLTWKAEQGGAEIFHAHAVAEARTTDSPELAVLVVDPQLQAVEVKQDGEMVGMSAPFCLNMQGVNQTIYYPQELGTNHAFIHSLTYVYTSDAPFHTQPVHVLLGETDKEDFSDNMVASGVE